MSIIKKRPLLILFLAIMFTSSLLRSTIVSIGPISEIVIKELNVSATNFGLITTIPLLVFALSSAIIPFIAGKRGLVNTLIGGLVLIIIGSLLRSINSYGILIIGTVILGFGISISNVLIPAIIKEYAQDYKPIFTSFYLCMQNFIASIASGIAFYVAIHFSWSFLMFIWTIPAIVALLLWQRYKKFAEYKDINNNSSLSTLSWPVIKSLLKSPYAWSLSIIMALQSVLYYTNVAWLPTIATNHNLSQEFVSFLMISFQLIPLPGLFLVPILFKRIKQDSYILLFSSTIIMIGASLLLVTKQANLFYIATLLLSLGAGTCFAWVVTTITIKSKDSQQASSLSAMSQTIGYTLAAVGPWLGGMIVDLTSNPQTIIIFLLGVGIVVALTSSYIYLRRKKLSFN